MKDADPGYLVGHSRLQLLCPGHTDILSGSHICSPGCSSQGSPLLLRLNEVSQSSLCFSHITQITLCDYLLMCVIIEFMSVSSPIVSPVLTQCQLALKRYLLNEEINELPFQKIGYDSLEEQSIPCRTFGKGFSNLNHFIVSRLICYSMGNFILNKNILWFKS